MPIFGNKFSPKKTPARKSVVSLTSEEPLDDLVTEDGTVSINLGNQKCTFQDGEWIADNGNGNNSQRAHQKLQRKIQQLVEENYLLKVKFEIMMNMLSQTTAESHVQQREIDKLKKQEHKR
ncbi:putative chibby homolog 1 [Trypoxylus dichotomus]